LTTHFKPGISQPFERWPGARAASLYILRKLLGLFKSTAEMMRGYPWTYRGRQSDDIVLQKGRQEAQVAL